LEMARILDALVDSAGNIQLMANQESKVQKSVSDLVPVQTQSMLERVRTGLVEQKPFLLYAKGTRNWIVKQSVEMVALKGQKIGVEESLNQPRDANSKNSAENH
jgi:hypothetical protein